MDGEDDNNYICEDILGPKDRDGRQLFNCLRVLRSAAFFLGQKRIIHGEKHGERGG